MPQKKKEAQGVLLCVNAKTHISSVLICVCRYMHMCVHAPLCICMCIYEYNSQYCMYTLIYYVKITSVVIKMIYMGITLFNIQFLYSELLAEQHDSQYPSACL